MIDIEVIRKFDKTKGITPHSIAKNLRKINALIDVDSESTILKIHKTLDMILRYTCNNFSIDTTYSNVNWSELIHNLSSKISIPVIIKSQFSFIREVIEDTGFGKQLDKELTEFETLQCINSLKIVLDWYSNQIIPVTDDDYDIVIYTGSQVTPDMIREASKIDFEVFPEVTIVNTELCLEWLAHNPDIYTIAVDTDTKRVVGYLNAMPLEDEYFRMYENDEIVDTEIPVNAIRKYNLPGFYKLLFCSVAVLPSYQGTYVFKRIFDSFMEKLLILAKKDIIFTEILSDAVTKDGTKLSEYFGMKTILQGQNGALFKASLIPPSIKSLTIKSKEVNDFYMKKYEELKGLLKPDFTIDLVTEEVDKKNKQKAIEKTEKVKILFLGSNPKGTSQLRLDEEIRELDRGLRTTKYRDKFELIQKWAIRTTDFVDAMIEVNPQIIHFSGHALGSNSGESGLAFEDILGNVKLISGEGIAHLLKTFATELIVPQCVVLNACYSSEQAEAILQYVPYVIGLEHAVDDRAAIAFSTAFYKAIGEGKSIDFAHSLGCSLIKLEGYNDKNLPILLKQK